ncbi:uncharacterized protein LOC121367498 isoform X5 [Gigantopelta aegis]|uniref:uncharacterized protein LOC121367498 isoform X5 n=1 Tax=Gigantopelta aegis TaxID=1735272 RepID=UPI001B8879BF|nr:uncharacterized protein LOC121367498 isoform X5 [Gigantopelta aegis]
MTWTLLIVPLLGALLIDASRSTSTTSSTSTTMSSSPTGSTLSLSSTQPPKVTSTKTPLQLLKPIHPQSSCQLMDSGQVGQYLNI